MDIQKLDDRLSKLRQTLEQIAAQYNATQGRISELEELKKSLEEVHKKELEKKDSDVIETVAC